LDLPHTTSISFSASQIPQAVLNRIQEATNAEDYSGPRLSFDIRNSSLNETAPLLDKILTDYFKIAEMQFEESPESFLGFIEKLEEDGKQRLATWLHRLCSSTDMSRSGESDKQFAQKIISYLTQADKNEDFRNALIGCVAEAIDTCGDRMILSVLRIGIAFQLATIDLNDPKKVAGFLKRGVAAIRMLEDIAEKKASTLVLVDKIEVYLAYPIKLKDALDLPIEVDKMLFFSCSGVTQDDLDDARKKVQEFLDSEQESLEFLVQQNFWVKTLAKHYPEKLEEINETRFKMLEDSSDQAVSYYKEALITLSKKLLAK